MLVMLRPDWLGTFKRGVRDEQNALLETLIFQDREPLELTESQFEAVKTDIGNSLCFVRENGKPDWNATADYANALKAGNEKGANKVLKKLLAAQKAAEASEEPAGATE